VEEEGAEEEERAKEEEEGVEDSGVGLTEGKEEKDTGL
jgi:hypothetical protein